MTEYSLRFLDYHAKHPHVFIVFERFALEAIAAGRKKIGAGMIYERMRWYFSIETGREKYKLNNNYRADYARMFAAKHPEHRKIFETRDRKTHDLVGGNTELCASSGWMKSEGGVPNMNDMLRQELQK
jgi:hypothetical protein